MFATLRFILDHPANRGARGAAILRYLRWQAGSRLLPGPRVHRWIGDIGFLVRRGETGLTGNIYCGLHEFAEMAYVLHALRSEDGFVDVGANAGSYTLLAAGVRGARAIAIEPVPGTFARLHANVLLNRLDARVKCLNIGLAGCPGELAFLVDGDTVNRVAAGADAGRAVATIPVSTLDAVAGDQPIAVIKIDVEGYELPVLRGAKATLARASLHSVIVETNGSGRRYGFDDSEVFGLLGESGFRPFGYDPVARELVRCRPGAAAGANTLFVRGHEEVARRLKAAPVTRVGRLAI